MHALRRMLAPTWELPRRRSDGTDEKRAAIERLCFVETVRLKGQGCEIADAVRNIGVIRPEALLVDRQRPAKKQLGLTGAVCLLAQNREIVEGCRDVG